MTIFCVSLFKELSKLNIEPINFNEFVTVSIDTLNNHAPSKKKYIRGNHLPFRNKELFKDIMSPRYSNTGLVSSRASLTSWGEGASLALVGHSSSDGVMIKMLYGIDVLHRPPSHPIFSYWVG